jgi:hypothetical protein
MTFQALDFPKFFFNGRNRLDFKWRAAVLIQDRTRSTSFGRVPDIAQQFVGIASG